MFFNECELQFRLDWRSQAGLPQDVNVQVRSCSVLLCAGLYCAVGGWKVPLVMLSLYVDPASGQQHSMDTVYQPCAKDRKETFLTKDGPMFKLREGVSSYPDSPLIRSGLQELKDRVKLLLILRTAEQVLFCTPPALH